MQRASRWWPLGHLIVVIALLLGLAHSVEARKPVASVKVVYFEGLSYTQLNQWVLERGGPAVDVSIPANEPNRYSIRYEGDYVYLTAAQGPIFDLPYSLFFFGVFPADVVQPIPNNDLCPEGQSNCANMIDYFAAREIAALATGHTLAIRVGGCTDGDAAARGKCARRTARMPTAR